MNFSHDKEFSMKDYSPQKTNISRISNNKIRNHYSIHLPISTLDVPIPSTLNFELNESKGNIENTYPMAIDTWDDIYSDDSGSPSSQKSTKISENEYNTNKFHQNKSQNKLNFYNTSPNSLLSKESFLEEDKKLNKSMNKLKKLLLKSPDIETYQGQTPRVPKINFSNRPKSITQDRRSSYEDLIHNVNQNYIISIDNEEKNLVSNIDQDVFQNEIIEIQNLNKSNNESFEDLSDSVKLNTSINDTEDQLSIQEFEQSQASKASNNNINDIDSRKKLINKKRKELILNNSKPKKLSQHQYSISNFKFIKNKKQVKFNSIKFNENLNKILNPPIIKQQSIHSENSNITKYIEELENRNSHIENPFNRLFDGGKKKKEYMQYLKMKQIKEDLDKCSFSPQINETSRKLTTTLSSDFLSRQQESMEKKIIFMKKEIENRNEIDKHSFSPKINESSKQLNRSFDNLLKWGKQRETRIKSQKEELAAKEMEEYTFHPKVSEKTKKIIEKSKNRGEKKVYINENKLSKNKNPQYFNNDLNEDINSQMSDDSLYPLWNSNIANNYVIAFQNMKSLNDLNIKSNHNSLTDMQDNEYMNNNFNQISSKLSKMSIFQNLIEEDMKFNNI